MNLGLVFGGQSYEHEISIVSAITLKDVLKKEVKFIFCDRDRDFYLIDPKNMKATYFSSLEYKKSKKLILKNGGFFSEGAFSSKKIDVQVYVNLIHGCDGEDGKLASLFEFFDVKFIGTRLKPAILSYDKVLTKFLANTTGVKTLNYQILKRNEEITIKPPFILKPATLGSSIGISIVKDESEITYALDKSFEFDDTLLVEPFFEGVRECNLAGYKADSKMEFSMIEEPNKDEFLDFDQKYLRFSDSKTIKEANLDEKLKEKLRKAFSKIYSYGFDGSLIRCDFFIIDDEIYLNEINTNPGSLAHYLFDNFEDRLYDLARNLPSYKKIEIDYNYVKSISVYK